MSAEPSHFLRRQHRILATLAIAHAFLLSVAIILLSLSGSISGVEHHIWVGFATLWLLWPFVLVLHSGRSLFRIAVAIFVSIVLLLPTIHHYRLMAPFSLGLPPGVDLAPWNLYAYLVAYRAGRGDARQDLSLGRLVVEECGLPPPGQYREILRQRYQIDLRMTGGCTNCTPSIVGHAEGYNDISKREIKRRYGEGILEAVAKEVYAERNKQAVNADLINR